MRPTRSKPGSRPQFNRVSRRKGEALGAKCRHCRINSGCASRGLCHRCYKDRPIRILHPAKSGQYFISGDPGHVVLPLAPEPCTCLPGTPERAEVYRWRVENNFQIFHPLDHKPTDD